MYLRDWEIYNRCVSKITNTIYLDEHLNQNIAEAFKLMRFRCIFIAKTTKYRGRDEIDYIGQIAGEGALFATSDIKFVDKILKHGIKHAGIALLPSEWQPDTLSFAAAGLGGILRGAIDKDDKRGLRNQIYNIADDGYHQIHKGTDKLIYSIGKMELDIQGQGY